MGIVGSLAKRRRPIASALVLVVLAGVPIAFAILHRGFPVADVDLESRDVWVTDGDALLAGRLNRQIEELDGAVSAPSRSVDVVQNGSDVFLVDSAAGALARIDAAYTTLVEPAEMPPGSRVALGADTLAVLSPAGELWAIDVANGLTFDPTTSPAARLGRGSLATVTASGAVVAVSVADQQSVRITAPGSPLQTRPLAVPEHGVLAAVGEDLVLLDVDGNRLIRDDGSALELPDAAYRLQQTGPESAETVLATGDSLLFVADNGAVREVSAQLASPVAGPDDVSAPVVVDGCTHGAWGGAQRYLLVCQPHEPQVADIAQRTQGTRLEFRVNRSVVALNDLDTGNVWVLDSEMRLVDNWEEVTPPEEQNGDDGDEKASIQSFEDTLAERTDTNRPPIARDDEYGVRPGRTTVLPVLDNDTDADGDVLTIPRVSDVPPAVGTVDLVDGGRALQFTPAPGASAASLRYTIDDGRIGGVAEGQVTIRVVGEGTQNPPQVVRETSIGVESGGTIDYDVLADFRDPDGDDLFLAAASPDSADIVRFTPDGTVTFDHRSGEPGNKDIALTVSDGTATTTAVLTVRVEPRGSLAPIGTPDFATAVVGEQIAIEPLLNDIAPNGSPLTLLGVDDVPRDAIVSANPERGTVVFQAPAAGAFYFLYTLAAGPASSIGLVRIDVSEPPPAAVAPIPVKDVAFLRAGEPTFVDVLSNDVSPDGQVLAVQSVDVEGIAAGVTVELLGNAVIRVSSSGALTTQTQFRYTVSDGVHAASSGVTIVPVPPIVNRQPPIAVDDRVRVRVGDVVNCAVLANDEHPDDAQLILREELVEIDRVGDGLAFVGDGMVRYQAGQTPGEYSVVYRVVDQYGESATARVTFVVVGEDAATNRPPAPLPQIARVFAGGTVPVEIPLDGIDPDGDSTVISGIERPGLLGVVDATTATTIQYTADRSSGGTDEIGYVVEDAFGAQAVGLLRIAVIPRPDSGQPPHAVDDRVEMAPGRTATVSVMLNDSDPSGHPLRLEDRLLEVDAGISAAVDGGNVVVEAPDEEGVFSIRYEIGNGNGGSDSAFLQVVVTEDAVGVYPTAHDHYVPVADVAGADTVTVSLDGLVSSPAGRAEELRVTVEGPHAGRATVDAATGSISVTPGERRMAVAYRVTNPDDGLSATAFLHVPPAVLGDYAPPPRLRDDLPPQVVAMNGESTWDLAEIVEVPSGRPAILVDPATVLMTHGDGTRGGVDADTIRFAAADGFRGIASVTFRVTDGTSGRDPDGRQALLTLPVIVGDPAFTDTPPLFSAQDITIEAGEAAATIDLRAATAHPNPAVADEFRYDTLTGATGDIAASLDGSRLRVSAALGVPPGAATTLSFTVRFRDFTVPGVVRVTVGSSTRPLARAVEDVAKGRRGVADTVDVLANDYDPFAAQGPGLRLVDAVIENAAASAASLDFTADGEITLRPGPAFIGVVSVVYAAQDATGDPSRVVHGRLLYTVRDVPGTPAAPTYLEGDGQVTLEWDTPATNGEPITQYTISWSGGSPVTVGGAAASYVFSGLTNGAAYTFRISATNVVGQGESSDSSGTARPYGTPTPVTSATATGSSDGSGDVVLDWAGATGNGRSIDGYRITASPGGAQYLVGAVATTRIPGRVGTATTYTIVTLGAGGESLPFGSTSAGTPRPGPPASATAGWSGTRGDRTVSFAWAAAPSTEPITRYEILVTNYHASWQDVGAATTYQITDAMFDTPYSVQVRAVSAGQTGDPRVSNAVTGLAPLPPSYSLCYHTDSGELYNIGVAYANTSAGIQLRVDIGSNFGYTTGSSGQVRLTSWAARTTATDLNRMITILVAGSAYSTTRWGDAPHC